MQTATAKKQRVQTATAATAAPRASPRKPGRDNTICHHDHLQGLVHYGNDLDYFSKSYQLRAPSFPRACAECKTHFCDKKSQDCKEGEWTVKSGPVYLCPLGANTNHSCTFGYCGTCFDVKGGLETKRERRPKRRRD